jgi:triacylglycerol lipase
MMSVIHRLMLASAWLFGCLVAILLSVRLDVNGWWTLPLVILMPVLLHALILATGFLVATWFDTGNWASFAARWRADFKTIIQTWWREIPSSVLTFSWLQPWRIHAPLPESSLGTFNPNQHPILFVHGYYCNRAMWLPWLKYWRSRPFGSQRRMSAITLEPPFSSIDLYTDTIAEAVRDLRQQSGLRPIVIAHSMGGLAARAFLRDHGKDQVCGLFTLGTPHQGTAMAYFGHGLNVLQMRPSSPWLLALAHHEARAGLPRCEVVLSEHDNIVTPRIQQTLVGVTTHQLRGLGHMNLAQLNEVWQLIEARIQAWESELPNPSNIKSA